MKMLISSLILVCIFFTGCNASQKSEPFIRFEDRIRIAEAFNIAENYCEKVWPGWGEVPLSLIFLTKDYEFLIHHPSPTPDFQSLDYDSLLNAELLFRERVFPERLLAAFQAVNNESSILMGTPEITDRSTSAWTITLLHEHFHQYQYFQPDYFEKSKALNLTRGDTTGMWMLNYDFPYEDPVVSESFHDLSLHLLSLVENRESLIEESIEAYWEKKNNFSQLVGEENYRYMQFQCWQEGVALYTEWKLLETMLDKNHQPSPDFKALKDFTPLDTLHQQIYQRIAQQLGKMNMPGWKRVSFYAFGAGEAILLDKLNPTWKEHYFDYMFEMDKLWKL